MWLIRQQPTLLPLELPRLDGSAWPDRRAVGRASFEVSTLYEIGYREGFEPAAHEVADRLMDELLPTVPLGNMLPEDAPYVRRVLMVAAQVGAGIGILEARTPGVDESSSDQQICGALWKALRDLPELPPLQRFAAAYLMHSGYYVARKGRNGSEAIEKLLAALRVDLRRTPPAGEGWLPVA